MGLRLDRTSGINTVRLSAVVVGCLALANCAASDKFARKVDPKYGVSASPRVVEFGQPVPKGGGTFRIGKPYVVAGQTYVPDDGKGYRAEGLASWYGTDFHGRLTANGEVFDMEGISAAHATLPIPSYARVTNKQNGRSMIVRVNDRGPYHGGRVIDVSDKAADLLGFKQAGTTSVRVEYVGPAPLEGTDDRQLEATLRERGPAPLPSAVMVASARPFVPQYEDAGLRGSVPVPPDRPFGLGRGARDEFEDDQPIRRGAEARQLAPPRMSDPISREIARSERYASPPADRAAAPAERYTASAAERPAPPSSGYRPAPPSSGYRPAPTAAGFVSGRGLY